MSEDSDDQACKKQVTAEGLQSWRDRSTPPRGRRRGSSSAPAHLQSADFELAGNLEDA